MSDAQGSAKVVPVPGPLYRIEKELYEPNYLKNVVVREAPPTLEFQFDRLDQFSRITNTSSSALAQSITEIQRNPKPNNLMHWHLIDTANSSRVTDLPQPDSNVYIHCAPRGSIPPDCNARKIRHRPHGNLLNLSESSGLTDGTKILEAMQSGRTSNEPNSTIEVCQKEFILSDRRRHFIYSLRVKPLRSDSAPKVDQRNISLTFPVLRRAAEQPAVVPWCVADEPYAVPDNTHVEYIDEYYWIPKIVYDARLDQSWSREREHLFHLLPDGATLPDNVIPAFTARIEPTSSSRGG